MVTPLQLSQLRQREQSLQTQRSKIDAANLKRDLTLRQQEFFKVRAKYPSRSNPIRQQALQRYEKALSAYRDVGRQTQVIDRQIQAVRAERAQLKGRPTRTQRLREQKRQKEALRTPTNQTLKVSRTLVTQTGQVVKKPKRELIATREPVVFLNKQRKPEVSKPKKSLFERKAEFEKQSLIGVGVAGKEIVDLGVKGLQSSVNYGKNLRKRFEKGENNPLFNDVKKLAKGTLSVSKYVKDNPAASAAIVGLAASQIGGSIVDAFVKNPARATGQAVVYLFPGTLVKGASKTIGTGVKGIKTATQVRRASKISKSIKPAKVGATPTQINKINNAISKASKTSNVNKQAQILRPVFKDILKTRGIQIKKGETIPNLVRKVNLSGKQGKVKVVSVKSRKPKVKKKKDVLRLRDLKKSTIDISTKKAVRIVRTKNGRKVIQRFKVNPNGTLTKVKKAEFERLLPKIKPKRKTKLKPKKIKSLDIKELSKKKFDKELREKGVIKYKGTTYVDINAINRIDKSTAKAKIVPRKDIFSNKRAQLRFQVQVQKQTRAKIAKVNRRLKTKKVLTKAEKSKILTELNKLKSILTSYNINRIIRAVLLINLVSKSIKAVKGVKPGTIPKVKNGQLPKFKTAPVKVTKPTKKPATDTVKLPAQKSPTKPRTKSTSTNKFKSRPVKKVTRTAKKTSKIPKLRFKLPTVRKGKRDGFIVKIKSGGKVVAQTAKVLPRNRAINLGREIVDGKRGNYPLSTSFSISKTGKTPITDVQNLKLSNKFRIKKTQSKKVQTQVERKPFRNDTLKERLKSKPTKRKKPLKRKKSKR